MFSRPIRVITMWGPLIGISTWGGFHLVDCAQTLFSPGTGFAIDYATPGGLLNVRCKTYAFDPIAGAVLAQDVEIRHPDGKLVARVPKLQVLGLYFDGSIAPKTVIQDGTFWVRRQADGKLDIAKYMESKKDEPSEVAFAVEVKNCRLNFLDELTPGVSTDVVNISSAYIAGKGSATHGFVDGSFNNWLIGRFEIKRFGGRTEVVGRKLRALPAPILARLRQGPEEKLLASIKPLAVKGGVIQADATVDISQSISWDIDATGTLEGLAWGKYASTKAKAKFRLSEKGFAGKLDADYKGVAASFDGSGSYEKAFVMAAQVKAKGVTQAVLSEYGLPKLQQISFDRAEGDGWISYAKDKFGFTGSLTAKNVAAYKLKSPTVTSRLTYRDDNLSGTWTPVQIGKTLIAGQFDYNTASGRWQAYAESNNARSEDFTAYSPKELTGTTGRIQLSAAGDSKKYAVNAVGLLDSKLKIGESKFSYDDAEFALAFDGKRLQVDRFRIQDRDTSLVVAGYYDLKKGFNLNVTGTGIDINKLYAGAKGRADIQGVLAGTIKNPVYEGEFNGYEVGYGELPGKLSAVAGNLTANRKSIVVKNLLAVRGAAQLGGNLTYGIANNQLAGAFSVKGLDVKELYDGPVTGLLDVEDIVVAGNASKPIVTATVSTKSILAEDFKIEDVKGSLRYEDSLLTMKGGTAKVGGGTLEDVNVQFNPNSKTGQVSGEFKQLKVEQLTERFREAAIQTASKDEGVLGRDVEIKGGLGGAFTVNIDKGEFSKLVGTGRIDDIRLNKAVFGSGDWSVGFKENTWTFDGMLGSLDDYIRVDAATYNTKTGKIGGEFIAYNLPMKELILAAEPQFTTSAAAFDRMKLLSGKVGLLATISGDMNNKVVEVPEFQISSFRVGKEDLGTFKLKATYADKDLVVQEGSLTGPRVTTVTIPFGGKIQLPDRAGAPDGTMSLQGKLSQHENLDFKATMFGFPVSKFSPLFPELERLDAFVTKADLVATGSITQPIVDANMIASVGFDFGADSNVPSVFRNRLRISSRLQSAAKGDLTVVNVDSTLKFSTLEGFANGKVSLTPDFRGDRIPFFTMTAGVNGEQSLAPLMREADGFDLGEKGATIKGALTASKTSEGVTFSGGLDVNAERVKYVKPSTVLGGTVSTWLQNFSTTLGIEKDAKLGYIVKNSGRATTNYSDKNDTKQDQGFATWNAGISIQDYANFIQNYNSNDPNVVLPKTAILDREIANGQFNLNRVTFGQTFPENTYATFTAYTDKSLVLSGSAKKPKISGELLFEKVKTALPSVELEPGDSGRPLIDPFFDIKFRLTDRAEVKAGTADLFLKGSGTLKGPLSEIEANGRLLVDSGSVNMPGGKLKLLPDGTLDLNYRAAALDNNAELIAALKAETQLTVLKNGITPERYDVTVNIDGDLLKPYGTNAQTTRPGALNDEQVLRITTNNPGGLSDDRVLQLLGRVDILQNAFQPGGGGNVEGDLRNALTSIALPNFLGGFTNNLAKNIGFDYVSIDYNSYEQASVNFAKSLGRGFFLQGRRQILPPLPNQPVAYDFRLAYRPRRGPNALRGLSFSLGTDQFRPYKFSIDLTQRLRTQNPSMRSYVWDQTNPSGSTIKGTTDATKKKADK